MANQKETLEFDSVTVYDPGGEQVKIPVSRKRMLNFLEVCTDGIVAVHPRKANILSPDQQMIEDLETALMLAHLFPSRTERAMKQSLTERQFIRVQQALQDRKTVRFNIIFLAKNDAICGEILTVDGGLSLVTLD